MQDGKIRYFELNHILEFNSCLISSELFSWRWVAIRFRSSGMWCRVVLQIGIKVSEERSVSIFREEDRGTRYIRKVGIFVYQLHGVISQKITIFVWINLMSVYMTTTNRGHPWQRDWNSHDWICSLYDRAWSPVLSSLLNFILLGARSFFMPGFYSYSSLFTHIMAAV
jgi:hypothetical protein